MCRHTHDAVTRRRSGFFYTPSTDTGKPGTPGYCGTRVPVIPFPAIVVNQRLARYRSTRYAATRQLRSLGTQQTRRAGSYSTRRSASPHAAGLRSCRRSAAQVVDARGHHPSVFGSMRDWGGNHGSGPRTQRKPRRGDRHKFSPPRPRGPRPSFRASCSNQRR